MNNLKRLGCDYDCYGKATKRSYRVYCKRVDKNCRPGERKPSIPNQEKSLIMNLLEGKKSVHIDEIIRKTGLTAGKVASQLVQLELYNNIKQLPGKQFAIK